MGFAPTWLRQVSPLLHMTTLTTGLSDKMLINGEGLRCGGRSAADLGITHSKVVMFLSTSFSRLTAGFRKIKLKMSSQNSVERWRMGHGRNRF